MSIDLEAAAYLRKVLGTRQDAVTEVEVSDSPASVLRSNIPGPQPVPSVRYEIEPLEKRTATKFVLLHSSGQYLSGILASGRTVFTSDISKALLVDASNYDRASKVPDTVSLVAPWFLQVRL